VGPSELLKWQWDGYPRYHRSRTNLLLHIVAVPLFWTGCVTLVLALVAGSIRQGALSLLLPVASLALQGRGHKLEDNPPVPFAGPANAIARIVLEQWVTFPRFVLSGGWARALRSGRP
jgi:2-hydroxy-palmitic acid dioxygenase Mpo1-like protein